MANVLMSCATMRSKSVVWLLHMYIDAVIRRQWGERNCCGKYDNYMTRIHPPQHNQASSSDVHMEWYYRLSCHASVYVVAANFGIEETILEQ